MARLRAMLALSRLSDRRWSATERSGEEKADAALFGAACAFAIFKQLHLLVFGPLVARLPAERLLVLCLCFAWIVVPLAVRPSIPVSSLGLFPLTRQQRVLYAAVSYLQNVRLFAVLGASLLIVAAEFWLPSPFLHATKAVVSFMLSAIAGLSLSVGLTLVQNRGRAFISRRALASHAFPMVRKELAYFRRTLDPYLALLLSLVAGYSEYLSAWVTPLRLLLPLLLIAVIQSSAVLNPFGLDTAQERERYKLLPISYRRVILQKHTALAVLSLGTTAPLIAALAWRMPFHQFVAAMLASLLVLVSWCCSGLLLMHTPSAHRVRMAFGTLSGDGMSIALAFGCAFLVCFVPVLAALIALRYPHLNIATLGSGLLLLAIVYGSRLCSLRG